MPSYYALLAVVLFLVSVKAELHQRQPHHAQIRPRTPVTVNASNLPTNSIASAWYAGWHSAAFPISQIDWSKYTEMTYAFALTTPDDSMVTLVASDQDLLPQFVSAAHKHKARAILSIGGWTGSRWFSSHVASPSNRSAFANAVNTLVTTYNLDGIEFDWEYPNRQGLGCNLVHSKDTNNFLLFLQALRDTPTGKNLTLSAATTTDTFYDTTGRPSTDVAAFATVLDHITVMNYDLHTPTSAGLGPNAPIDDTCAPSATRNGSAVAAVESWSKAGFPKSQIVLGVPAYGHSYSVSSADALASNETLKPFPTYNSGAHPVGDKWDSTTYTTDACGAQVPPGGVYTYWGLIDGGFLNSDGSVGTGIVYRYDNCSETPYAYNPNTQIMVSFDNAQSFSAKGDFIKTQGLHGFTMWETGGDINNTLVNAILNGMVNGDPSRPEKPQPVSGSGSNPLNPKPGSSHRLGASALALVLFVLSTSMYQSVFI